MHRAPTIADVAAIAGTGDPVLRNLRITQCYHELSLSFAARTGRQANWCTFATWASKQAGQTIRHEDLARALQAALGGPVVSAQTADAVSAVARELGPRADRGDLPAVLREALDPAAAVARAGAAVTRGNLKVFEEIGREFARFHEQLAADSEPDAGRLAGFVEELRPGAPPDGQEGLRRAFAHYYAALFEPDPKARLEELLLANLEVGRHEQTRLQPEIAAALDAGFIDPGEFRARVLAALFPYRGWLIRAQLALLRAIRGPSPLELAIGAFLASARPPIRLAITEHLMALTLPDGRRLRLGSDLPASFPPELARIQNPELLALLGEVDPTPDRIDESGAVDWADLAERLHFIADLFRCYADAASLFEAPFTASQAAEIRAGRRPGGAL
jgi:hypothetical protein